MKGKRDRERVKKTEWEKRGTGGLMFPQSQVIRSCSCSKASTLASRLSFQRMEQACPLGT